MFHPLVSLPLFFFFFHRRPRVLLCFCCCRTRQARIPRSSRVVEESRSESIVVTHTHTLASSRRGLPDAAAAAVHGCWTLPSLPLQQCSIDLPIVSLSLLRMSTVLLFFSSFAAPFAFLSLSLSFDERVSIRRGVRDLLLLLLSKPISSLPLSMPSHSPAVSPSPDLFARRVT